MNRLIFLITVLSGLASVQVEAAVISVDWKTPGDGLLTYDTVNQREWLDLSQTLLSDQFPGTGANDLEIREARYQYVVGETVLGGLFEGFRVAKSPDVIALAQSAGIDTSTFNHSVNSSATSLLGMLLSYTVEGSNGNKAAVGILDEFYEPNSILRMIAEVQSFNSHAGIQILRDHNQYQIPPGVFLYRVIPEPSASSLILLAVVNLNLCRRFRIRH